MKEYQELAEWLEAISRDIREVKEAIADLQAEERQRKRRPIELPDALSVEELAIRLRVSRRTIDRRRAAGTFRIPEGVNEAGRPYFRREDVERYMAQNLVGGWGGH